MEDLDAKEQQEQNSNGDLEISGNSEMEEHDGDDSEVNEAYITGDELDLHRAYEIYLANASFVHGHSFHKELSSALATME